MSRGDRPFAVVDLGSNTVRLVVFEGKSRVPTPMFNERFFCGLGRGLSATGRLDQDAVPQVMTSLDRFRRIAESLGASRLNVLATAAVRDGADGAELVRRIERRIGTRVTVLSGSAEAGLAAAGVISGMPEADGIVGDLGGGSLELADVKGRHTGRTASLPLGPLRLTEFGRADSLRMVREVTRQLRQVQWLSRGRGRTFYAVGGSWRALAVTHMALTSHPVHMVHGYSLGRADAQALAQELRGPHGRELAKLAGVAERRLDLLPRAATVLERLIARMRPHAVVFSATGLREGFLFEQLDRRVRAKDPLIAAAEELAAREARDPAFGVRLAEWTKPLFPREKPEETRLRTATCLLNDTGWREHPDYRAEQVFLRILRHPFLALGHEDRVMLAAALYVAAGGKLGKAAPNSALELLDRDRRHRAAVMGAALRLAYVVSGGAIAVLAHAQLTPRRGRLDLELKGKALPASPNVESALRRLVRAGNYRHGRVVGV
jgi:exopolyphosphatase/guanosine-5'-triphosphate,3'-diphosphate pyrophosphatase